MTNKKQLVRTNRLASEPPPSVPSKKQTKLSIKMNIYFLWVIKLGRYGHNVRYDNWNLFYNCKFRYTIPVIHNARIFHVAERGGTRPKVHLRWTFNEPSFTFFYLRLPSFTFFYLLLPSFTFFYLHLPSFIFFYLLLPSFTFFYLLLPSFKFLLKFFLLNMSIIFFNDMKCVRFSKK